MKLKEIEPVENWVDSYCIDIECLNCRRDLLIHSGDTIKCKCGKQYKFEQNNKVYEVTE